MHPLVHIGYHKTGSTWLQRSIFPSTDAGFAFVAGPKERRTWWQGGSTFWGQNPFDFDAEVVRETFEPKIGEAEARNLVPVISHERFSGSPYGAGYDSRQTADRLAAVFPDARILVVIREQVSMLGSLYKQYVKRGGASSFDQFISIPPGAAGGMPMFRFDFYEYNRLISYYQSLFGAEDVLALPYELLRDQPKEFLARIGAFLGTPAAAPKKRKLNPSPSALSLALKRQANRLIVRDGLNPAPPLEIRGSNPLLLKACRRIDKMVPARVLEGYERRWREYVEHKVGDRYAKSNAITSRLIGIDLQQFGYT